MSFQTSVRRKKYIWAISLRNFLLVAFLLFSGFLHPSCSLVKKSGYTRVVKPIKRSKPYNPKKNRHAKRTRTVWRKVGY